MRRGLAGVAIGIVVLGGALAAAQFSSGCDDGVEWRLACRLASYGKYQEGAWAHLQSIGVRYVFLSVPAPGEVERVKERLRQHGLEALVLRGQADLGRADAIEVLERQLATCQAMGVSFMFLSPRHTGIPAEAAYAKLREAGERARAHGVTIALETHPDLGMNATEHLETMRRVDHPNVRVNFDTGNISFYNEGADAVAELSKVVAKVATLELKDHDRRLRSWTFPALGKGRVDLAGILRVLDEAKWDGPVTIEVEGVEGQRWTEQETQAAIAESVAYLRRLHRFR